MRALIAGRHARRAPDRDRTPQRRARSARRPSSQQARERWSSQHARDYTYRLRLSCFCLPTDPVKIRVRDGKPRGTPRRLRRLDTIEELFARIQEEIAKRTAGLDVRYGPRGVPLDFSADPIPMAIDDEYTVRVRRLRIERRG